MARSPQALRSPSPVSDVSLLHDRIYAASRVKGGLKHIAGADAVRLARRLRHDAGARGAMDGSQLSQIIEAGLKLACRHQRLLSVRGSRPEGNLRGSGSIGALQTAAIGHQEIDC